ncbi:MAG: DUF1028 domain-containing protein [Dehalococcoidia bacterium]|jgi:uncharacterized Ntn-hydrolase superfamily protein|nr:DUF1028 domain-containing protein [Dehalococcoidia bacterium]
MPDLVHTYSIVALDPETDEMGVAVQSHYFGVGAGVPWAESGVGVVASQAMSDPAYGPRGLDSMRSGTSAPETLNALLQLDDAREIRQVAMVDVQGRAAAHTGAGCIRYAGHHVGDHFSVQANMMLTDEVVPAMRDAYTSARGPLPERLLAALEAAQAAGGDIRGRQSAAMLVVNVHSSGQPWNDVVADLRVDDHPEPLEELRRLLILRRAYHAMSQATDLARQGDIQSALVGGAAARELAPDNLEIAFWGAVAVALSGQMAEATGAFDQLFAIDPNWAELLRRLPAANLLPRDLVTGILGATDHHR